MAHNLIRLWPTTASDCGPHHQPIIRLWPTTELDCDPHHQTDPQQHQTVAHTISLSSDCGPQQHQTVAHTISLSSDCGPQQRQTVAHIIRLQPTAASDCGPNHQSVPAVVQVNISLTWSQITSLKTGGQKDETYFGVFTLNTGQLCCLVQATTRKKKMKEFWLNQ